jgi:hypothetical protein
MFTLLMKNVNILDAQSVKGDIFEFIIVNNLLNVNMIYNGYCFLKKRFRKKEIVNIALPKLQKIPEGFLFSSFWKQLNV